MAVGPKCFRCWIQILSGPVDWLVLLLCIAFDISFSVKRNSVVSRLLTILLVFLLSLSLLCLTMFVNWLLNFWAICCWLLKVLLLKVIDLFIWVCCFSFDNWLNVFQRMCEFVLWSQFWFNLSFQILALWSEISFVMVSFKDFILLSVGLFFLSLFLSWILSLIVLGNNRFLLAILPLGTCFLSAFRIALVSILLALWTLLGFDSFSKESSMSPVNAVQLAFL